MLYELNVIENELDVNKFSGNVELQYECELIHFLLLELCFKLVCMGCELAQSGNIRFRIQLSLSPSVTFVYHQVDTDMVSMVQRL